MRTALPALLVAAGLSTACAGSRSSERPAPPALPPPTTTTTTTVTGPAAPKPFTMRTYFMGFLRRGPKWSKERTPEAQAAGEGHMANIKRLGACGKLLIAGPFKHPADAPDQGPLAGIFLFDVATQEEAEALMRTDPAIIAGRFTMEVLPWYGPAGLTYDGHVPVAPGTPCAP
jgi:uncharacterized protein YciI